MQIRHKDGYTPLHYAHKDGKLEAVECLMKHRAEIEIQNIVGINSSNCCNSHLTNNDIIFNTTLGR